MDMFLPGMNGSDAIRILRSQGNDVTIIMLTAGDDSEERTECLASGADDFVTKPVDRRTLVEAIDAHSETLFFSK
jgi:DNA-binding response OmpR family regulator